MVAFEGDGFAKKMTGSRSARYKAQNGRSMPGIESN